MEELAKECGFDSIEDFKELVNSLNLSTQDRIDEFKEWQNNDGSKDGLIKIYANRKQQDEHNKYLDEMSSDYNRGIGYV
jgi:hypothetical protein